MSLWAEIADPLAENRKKTVKLGRTSAHRNELLANLVCALINLGNTHTSSCTCDQEIRVAIAVKITPIKGAQIYVWQCSVDL